MTSSRNYLPVVMAILLGGLGIGMVYLAVHSYDTAIVPPTPLPQATSTPTREAQSSRVEPSVTPIPTRQPGPSPTALISCNSFWYQGGVCVWPTATQTLPLPTCVTEVPGQICINDGPRLATVVIAPTQTPKPLNGEVASGKDETS